MKARQLGITTAVCIHHLDRILWEKNAQIGTIAHTRDDAEDIFKDKLKFAFDNLDPRVRAEFRLLGDSAKELMLSNGSLIRVGTSLRSSTLQSLHITEFGKICAKYPDKAREIITGSLNTVHVGQDVIIESTAEGKQGYFYEMCQEAFLTQKSDKPLSPLQWRVFFFPWWREISYSIEHEVEIGSDLRQYFDKLHLQGISLTNQQKWWYASKYKVQKEDMLREFPSTPEEAFASSHEGSWYSTQIKELYDKAQVTNVSYDKAIPVHTSWDLGQADFTAIWFFQVTRSGDINIIDYFERANTPIDQLAAILKSKNYSYGIHIWPADANSRDRAGITFVQQARKFNLSGVVIDQSNLLDGINLVRTTLSKCWFDQSKCQVGLNALSNYQKKWSSSIGGFTSEPLHNEYSHGADAFRYLCQGISRVQASSGSLENDYKALRKFWG